MQTFLNYITLHKYQIQVTEMHTRRVDITNIPTHTSHQQAAGGNRLQHGALEQAADRREEVDDDGGEMMMKVRLTTPRVTRRETR